MAKRAHQRGACRLRARMMTRAPLADISGFRRAAILAQASACQPCASKMPLYTLLRQARAAPRHASRAADHRRGRSGGGEAEWPLLRVASAGAAGHACTTLTRLFQRGGTACRGLMQRYTPRRDASVEHRRDAEDGHGAMRAHATERAVSPEKCLAGHQPAT